MSRSHLLCRACPQGMTVADILPGPQGQAHASAWILTSAYALGVVSMVAAEDQGQASTMPECHQGVVWTTGLGPTILFTGLIFEV